MEWTEAFKVVFAMVASVGGASAIILILSSWLVKVWGQRILSRERAELHRLAKQHEISFSQLHVERAHVIKDLYEKLVDLYDSMQSLNIKYSQSMRWQHRCASSILDFIIMVSMIQTMQFSLSPGTVRLR